MNEYQKMWNDFWLPMLKDSEGNINMEQLAKELYDYVHVLRNVRSVYATITGGEISNPATAPEFVIAYADAYYALYYGIDLGVVSSEQEDVVVDSFFTNTYNSRTLH